MNNKIKNYQEFVDETVKLLMVNHNLILTGAPGTGKTHLAKETAKSMLGLNSINDLKSCSRFGFVQFHPSYDYTDFVEGLRPVTNNRNNAVHFVLRNGIFKNFCTKAITKAIRNESLLRKAYDEFVNNNDNKESIQIEDYTFKVIENKIKYVPKDEGKNGDEHEWSYDDLEQFCDKSGIIDPENITKDNVYNVFKLRWDSKGGSLIFREIIKIFREKNQEDREYKPIHVFVIDEINRGEISKIFGELFYSLDPGYRGQDGAVQTQYANMQTEENEFDKILKNGKTGQFFIPENVYIIGTMNDIDRSVESMDFAMRRRFAFYEVKAKDTQDTILKCLGKDDQKEAISRMNKLNEKICEDGGFSEAYQIGAAYFKKVELFIEKEKEKEKEKWEKLWKYYLEGTLREYLRGRDDEEDILLKWKEAYDNEQNDSNS